jgi:hypothetical protein
VLVGVVLRFFVFTANGRNDLVEGKCFSNNGRGSKYFVAALTDSIEAAADCFLYALRDHQIGDLSASPFPAPPPYRTLFDQRLQHFFHEERVALCLAVNRFGEVSGHSVVEQGRQLLASFVRSEAAQHDASHKAFAIPINQSLGQWVRPVELDLAIGCGDQHSRLSQIPEQVADQPKCAAISPVQIVDVEQQTAAPGKFGENMGYRVKEQQPFLVRGQ